MHIAVRDGIDDEAGISWNNRAVLDVGPPILLIQNTDEATAHPRKMQIFYVQYLMINEADAKYLGPPSSELPQPKEKGIYNPDDGCNIWRDWGWP